MTARAKITFRILLLLYIAAVCFLCFARFDDTPSVPLQIFGIPTDKLVHFLMFAPFPVLAWFAFGGKRKGWRRYLALALILGVGVLLSLSTEVIQQYIPYRNGDWTDFAADLTGLVTSTLILLPFVCKKD